MTLSITSCPSHSQRSIAPSHRRLFMNSKTPSSRRVFSKDLLGTFAFGWTASWGALIGNTRAKAECWQAEPFRTFAYYQGLGPNQSRSPSRADGTYYKMPCIEAADIAACQDKVYEFWHGHGQITHRFTVTAEDFSKIARGETIEVFTDLVEGHRHAVRLDPNDPCDSDS